MATIYKSGVKTLELSQSEEKPKVRKTPPGVEVKAPAVAPKKSTPKKSKGYK